VGKFQLGRVVITQNALDKLFEESVQVALGRHAACDWGDLDEEDKQSNDGAVVHGFRILSAYQDKNNVKFWIITEANRSVTTVLLPEDY
jgi:hypothetical protein